MSDYLCKFCGKPHESFQELIRHIIASKSTHPKWMVKWAGEKSMNIEYLNQKVSRQQQNQGRVELTEQERENKDSCQREDISGIRKTKMCYCVNCRQIFPASVEVEFLQSPFAWRNEDKLVVTCGSCSYLRHQPFKY